jgi:hypothetical protein
MRRARYLIAKLIANPAELDRWSMVEYFVWIGSATPSDQTRWHAMASEERDIYRQRLFDRIRIAAERREDARAGNPIF